MYCTFALFWLVLVVFLFSSSSSSSFLRTDRFTSDAASFFFFFFLGNKKKRSFDGPISLPFGWPAPPNDDLSAASFQQRACGGRPVMQGNDGQSQ